MKLLVGFFVAVLAVLRLGRWVGSRLPDKSSLNGAKREEREAELRRIAAAFGVYEVDIFDGMEPRTYRTIFGKDYTPMSFWMCGRGNNKIGRVLVETMNEQSFYVSFFYPNQLPQGCWYVSNYRGEEPIDLIAPGTIENAEEMLRAFYCLGLDSRVISEEYKLFLSAHEQMDLRLSMPREFWSKQWVDEAKAD